MIFRSRFRFKCWCGKQIHLERAEVDSVHEGRIYTIAHEDHRVNYAVVDGRPELKGRPLQQGGVIWKGVGTPGGEVPAKGYDRPTRVTSISEEELGFGQDA